MGHVELDPNWANKRLESLPSSFEIADPGTKETLVAWWSKLGITKEEFVVVRGIRIK
jgi:hypothetical protein